MKEKLISKKRACNDFRHLFRVAKLSLLLSFMMLNNVFAGTGQPKINLDVKLESMRSVFKEIKEQSGFYFVYNEEEVDNSVLVTAKLNDATLDRTMSEVLKSTGYEYVIIDDYVVVKREDVEQEQTNQDQSRTLKGIVKDASNGEALIGVNIYTQDKSAGAVTNFNGEFQILTNQNSTSLIFSYIGFEKAEVKITDKEFYVVELKASTSDIDEVVVTGIFTRKEESFTGSAMTIKAEELERVSNSNVFESLKNIDPSLNIMESTEFGSDPNRLPQIQLRGTASFPGGASGDLKGNFQDDPNQPLFILDGFPTSATTVLDMDMQRIASITILKDAAAKAIYGSKAGNGVVVIETKRPLNGDLRLSYNGSATITTPDLSSYNLTNALEKLEVEQRNGVYDATNVSTLVDKQKLYNYRLKKSLEGDDTYWLSKPLRTAIGSKHAITVEFGEQKTKFIANLSYANKQGVMKRSGRENINGSLSLEYRFDNLLFRNSISITSNNSKDSPYGGFDEYVRMNPYWDAYNDDGTVAIINPDQKLNTNINPLHNAKINTMYKSSYFELTNNFYTEWKISKDLKLTSRIGLTKKTSDAHRFRPSTHTVFNDYEEEDVFRKGDYQLNNGKSDKISGDINMQFSKSINKHFIMSNIGLFVSSATSNEVVNYAEGFPSDKITDISFALQYEKNKTPLTYENTVRDLGALAVLAYSYDDRFLSDFTLRQNASSSFGSNKRWGTFWSAGLGWNLHNEIFMKGVNGLDRFKIKGSAGTSGSQNFSAFQSLSTYKYYQDRNYNGQLGAYVKQLANEGLQWQQKFDFNVGFDLKFHRLSLVFDYYQSNTENLITELPTAPSIGFGSIIENIGKVKNEGFELKMSYQLIKNEHGFLNVNFSAVTNENEIVELSDAMKTYNKTQDEAASERDNNKPVLRYFEGGSMNSIWAVKSLGIDPATGRELYEKLDGSITTQWDAKDQTIVGNSLPKYRGNFGLSGEINRIGFSVVARFLTGGDMYNQTLADRVENIDPLWNVDKRVIEGRWKEAGQLTQFKNLGRYYNQELDRWVNVGTKPTSRFVQSRSELDISSISMYYDFKKSFIQKIGLERLKISAHMNDVYKFSSIKIERGLQYPFARSISFSLKATF